MKVYDSKSAPNPRRADPIVRLAFAAAVTKKLRLATGVVILPQRHPLYVAKRWRRPAAQFRRSGDREALTNRLGRLGASY